MAAQIPHTRFGRRLRAELQRQDVSVRELARRMNQDDPEGQRRNIARWLTPDPTTAVSPSRTSVAAAASALGVETSVLDGSDEEEDELPLTRDESQLFFDLLRKVVIREEVQA